VFADTADTAHAREKVLNPAHRGLSLHERRVASHLVVCRAGRVPHRSDHDGREMRAWLVTPVALAVVGVSVRFDAGVAVAGDSCGQNTYANAQASAVSSRCRPRS
jgi:hypothetical protein